MWAGSFSMWANLGIIKLCYSTTQTYLMPRSMVFEKANRELLTTGCKQRNCLGLFDFFYVWGTMTLHWFSKARGLCQRHLTLLSTLSSNRSNPQSLKLWLHCWVKKGIWIPSTTFRAESVTFFNTPCSLPTLYLKTLHYNRKVSDLFASTELCSKDETQIQYFILTLGWFFLNLQYFIR